MPVDSPLNPTNTTAAATTTTTTAAAPISFTLTTAAAATTTPASIARPLANQAPSRPVISSIPQTHHLHYPPQALYSAVRTPNHQLPKLHQDASQPILYPVASSGRGFVPRPIRPVLADQTVTVANPAGYPHRPVVSFSHRPIGSPHFDSMGHPMHLARPPNLQQQQQLIPLSGSAILGSMKGTPNSSDPKVFPPSTICDSNGCKEMRVRDDALCVVRDRKVRITDGTSLYALCRSWLRNGSQEESQPQYGTFFRSLPRPLPIPVAGAVPSQKKEVVEEVDKEDKDEASIEQLSTQEVLKRHVRRAKKVRSRLREERLQRIERYKTRLALLLPPPIEQLRTDSVTGS